MENNMKKSSKLKLILRFMKGSVHIFILSMIATLCVSLLELVYPQIIRLLCDSIIGNDPIDPASLSGMIVTHTFGIDYLRENLWAVAVMIIAFAALIGVFKYLSTLLNTSAAETLCETTRNTLFEKIQSLPYAWHTSNPTGDIIQRCTSDVETIKRFLSEQLTQVISTVMLITLSIVFLSNIHSTFAIIAAISIPVVVAFSGGFHILIRKGFAKCDENEGVLSSIVQENLTGVRVVRAFGRENAEIDKFTAQNRKYTGTWLYLCKILSGFWAVNDIIACVQVLVIILSGIYLCVDGSITVGDFLAAVSYNAMLTWPVRRLGRMISEMSKATIALDRLGYIVNADSEKDPEDALDADMSGDIVFDGVTFSYDGRENVLEDVSFKIESGTTLGILGGTGSGKSTLVQLLCKLYTLPENGGKITVAGVDINSISSKSIRENVGIVLQEPFLFSRTISENIAISKEGATEEEIESSVKIACLDKAISDFKNGYDTIVGERGVTLSGGQKQRVAIARILLRGTPVIIFDDSLSAVDAETDSLIRAAIKRELSGSTVIIISHRISSIMHADNIIVLDRGKIAENGTHDELLTKDGIYKRVFDLQHTDSFNYDEEADV
ncbi:MAG: ABC transporter ATP-binding protein [Clostridia bacterium]|nr:ABC transporter ATP-binding protein [Clostridia bacterium]